MFHAFLKCLYIAIHSFIILECFIDQYSCVLHVAIMSCFRIYVMDSFCSYIILHLLCNPPWGSY